MGAAPNGAPAEPSEAGLLGRGGARERSEGDQRKPEQERTLRRRGKVDCPKGKTEEEKGEAVTKEEIGQQWENSGTKLRQIWDKFATKMG